MPWQRPSFENKTKRGPSYLFLAIVLFVLSLLLVGLGTAGPGGIETGVLLTAGAWAALGLGYLVMASRRREQAD